ncbi:DUF4282 domain-containing protein [Luteimonas sp. MJ174]|uniref:DUF4282 domain-containing protein n=1 Tax=Luteimonas sp. MJ174 TaxID=3129237 RepID=UPI0031BAA7E9
MGKLCLLCKYERRPEDQAPETECPGCGAIYANVEAQRKAAAASAQARALVSVRARRTSRQDKDGFILFRTMVTPWLAVAVFVLVLVSGGIGVVYGVLAGDATMVVTSVVGILATRIGLECVTVFFRIADDLQQAKEVLFEMQEQQLRSGLGSPPGE